MGLPGRAFLVLIAPLAACASPAGPSAGSDPGREGGDRQALAVVDELGGAEVGAWTELVWKLDEPLRSAVARELGRRVIEIADALPRKPEGVPKEIEALQKLIGLSKANLEPFTDFIVWASIHKGREGLFTVWKFGEQAFPSLLKLRRDRHFFVHMMVGYGVVDYVLGSFRGKASTDARIEEFCRKEEARCLPELRAHYRAILAAIGDGRELDSLRELLNSDTVTDWLYAHQFIDRMFPESTPYRTGEIGESNGDYTSREQGVRIWSPLNERILKWWGENRPRMSYNRDAGTWAIKSP